MYIYSKNITLTILTFKIDPIFEAFKNIFQPMFSDGGNFTEKSGLQIFDPVNPDGISFLLW